MIRLGKSVFPWRRSAERRQQPATPPQTLAILFVADCAMTGCETRSIAHDSVVSVPEGAVELRVLRGRAWVTVGRQDVIACAGEALPLAGLSGVVVSPAGMESVELQLFYEPPQPRPARTQTQEVRHAFYDRLAVRQRLIDVESRRSW